MVKCFRLVVLRLRISQKCQRYIFSEDSLPSVQISSDCSMSKFIRYAGELVNRNRKQKVLSKDRFERLHYSNLRSVKKEDSERI